MYVALLLCWTRWLRAARPRSASRFGISTLLLELLEGMPLKGSQNGFTNLMGQPSHLDIFCIACYPEGAVQKPMPKL